jgi:NAD(P)-dependent dehydrogenase (short-subunit alcohol dehydrogenase family)
VASAKWKASDMPDLDDKTIVVTGANAGLGLATVRELARKGARVILACRNLEKAAKAVEIIRGDTPDASLEVSRIDLGDLGSVHEFADRFAREHERLDVLVNNGGVMALPRSTTVDGFETQLGVNHLGHFALTGLLLERLLAAPSARVVTVSSLVHRIGRIDFDDLDGERSYHKWTAYAQSKLANLLFAFELQRRFETAGLHAASIACHPGYASTNLQQHWAQASSVPLMSGMSKVAVELFGQDAESGALPILFAATDPRVAGGDFVGPGGWMEIRGRPRRVKASRRAYDREAAARLWDVSVERTGVVYPQLAS